jgi:putative ABC transport system permease protein
MRSIRIALRNIYRLDNISALNLTGLSVGIFSVIVLGLFGWTELSHDTFLPDYKKIYRITTHYVLKGNEANWALNHGIMDSELEDKLPNLDHSTAFIKVQSEKVFYSGDLSFTNSNGFYVDEDFFEVFNFNFLYGDLNSAIRQPNSIVITQSLAKAFFGKEDAVGREIEIQEIDGKTPLVITGVVKDFPANSYIKFDFVISGKSYQPWDLYYSGKSGNMFYVFFKTLNQIDAEELQQSVNAALGPIKKEFYGAEYEPSESFRLDNPVQRIDKIYFNAKNEFEISAGGNQNYTILVGIVGVFILAISVINYINLTISSSFSKRKIKEFAVRKLLGSSAGNLLAGFALEISIWVFMAIVGSLIILKFIFDLFPAATDLISSPFSYPGFYLIIIICWILLSLITSVFPASKFLNFNIVQSAKGNIQVGGSRTLNMRNLLVVFQVILTAILISNSSLLFRQLNFLTTKNAGFKTSQIIEVKRSSNMTEGEWSNFMNKTKSLSFIKGVGGSQFTHISDMSNAEIRTTVANSPFVKVAWNSVSHDFIPTLEIQIARGRNFSPDLRSDYKATVINETAARALNIDEPEGKFIIMWGDTLQVVGIVDDFHFQSFSKPISPLIFLLRPEGLTYVAYIKFENDDTADLIGVLNDHWDSENLYALFDYRLMQDNFKSLLEKEEQMANIVASFTIVAIILAILGLIGLVSHDAGRKSKEIAIKKILGAPILHIILLINRRFAFILIAGFTISLPLAIWIGNYWLEVFVYRISISVWDVLVSVISIALLGVLTSSLITYNAASSNPVNVIRNE